MSQIDQIIGIFNQFNPLLEDSRANGFYFLYLLDQKGFLSLENAQKLYNERFKNGDVPNVFNLGYIGPFENLDSLNRYAFQLCEELNAEKVSLISVHEYNTFLENNQQALDFHQDLLEKGNIMENIEHKKKGFFSRLFN